MSYLVNGHNIFIILFVCFFASILLIGLIRKLSIYFNIVDIPNKEQKIHKGAMPLMGGVGIFLAFLLGYILFAPQNTIMLSILISSFLILITGMLEDFGKKEKLSIPPVVRLIVQVLIAVIIVFYGGLKMDKISLFGWVINFGSLAPYISMLFIVAIINAMNFIDGIDGLCGGISSIYFLTISVIGLLLNKFGGLDIILSLIMAGSTLGYVIWNFPPSKIYQGDTGATFVGLMISVICLIGFKTLTLTSLVIPLLVLAIPIFDTILAIIRRLLKGQSPMEADRRHFHHQLMKFDMSYKKKILLVYAINIVFSIITIVYAVNKSKIIILGYVLLLFMLIFLILKTNIIFERDGKKKDEDKVKK